MTAADSIIAYRKVFPVLWTDLDPNGHMRGTRYLEYAAEVPILFLVEHGFDFGAFAREQIGPVTFRQAVTHHKEVRFGDHIAVDYRLRGLSPDASRWAFRHRITRGDGAAVAIVEWEGAFFGLTTRKIVSPPAGVVELVRRLPRDEDFTEL